MMENRTLERKMSHLNIAFDRYASIGTVMHYILVISHPYTLRLVFLKVHVRSSLAAAFLPVQRTCVENVF